MGQSEIRPLLTIMEMPDGSGYIRAMDKHPKRPRDPSQLAKMIVDLATGSQREPEETKTQKRASKAGRVGGNARAKVLSSSERSEIASVAAQARWKKQP